MDLWVCHWRTSILLTIDTNTPRLSLVFVHGAESKQGRFHWLYMEILRASCTVDGSMYQKEEEEEEEQADYTNKHWYTGVDVQATWIGF